MAEQVKKPIGIMETVLRDAHQSLIATRMPTEIMLPIVDKMDKVGYHAVECWGGATFDASLRFLKEDPWDRLRKLRDGFKNTKLQMLFRGQNILGYRPYADDVVYAFVEKSIANGIDVIRIFDCLNDLRNLQAAVDATGKIKQQEGVEHLGKMLRGKIGYLHRFILAKLLILGGKFTCYFKQVSDYSMILTGIQGSGKRVVIFFFHSFSTFLVKYICLICATVTIRRSTTLRYHTIIYTLNRCLNGSLL